MKRIISLSVAFSGRFLSAAGVIALSIILSRQLSLAEASLFFEAFITLMGLAIALQFGMPLMILRKVARLKNDPTETDAILARALSSIYALCIVVVLGWIMFFFTAGGFDAPLSWVWVDILPAAVMGPLSSFIKAQGRPGWGGFWEVGVLSLIGSAGMLVVRPDAAMDAWIVFSIGCWAGMLLALIHAGVRHLTAFARPIPDFPLLFEGRHLWAVAVLSYASLWGGVLIAESILGPEATAVLNALFRTLAPLQFLILTIDFYMAPKFATAKDADLSRLYTRGRIACAVMAVPYVVLTLALPSQFLVFLYGEGYGMYGTELRVIIAAILVQIALGPAGILLNMRGRDRVVMFCMGFKAMIYLLLSFVVGSQWGVLGIAIALAVAAVVQSSVQYLFASLALIQRSSKLS